MPAITTSANAIIEVNQALQVILKKYLPDSDLDIRFDLPDVNTKPATPTVSIFLYDVHEDLQLRQSEMPRVNVVNSTLRAGWVNLNCNYLITYWETQEGSGSDPSSKPDNQAAQIMTLMLRALLNNRELEGIAGAYTRIIPPQENLNSLGNFWQALGNRPRLSLMYSITVPILLDNSMPQTLVKTTSSDIVPAASVDLKVLNNNLWKILAEQLGSDGAQKLARVRINSQQQTAGDTTAIKLSVNISGTIDKAYQSSLQAEMEKWENKQSTIITINGAAVHITALNSKELNYV